MINHTELVARLREAAAVVEEADLAESLEAAAFQAVFSHLVGGDSTAPLKPQSAGLGRSRAGDEGPIARIAQRIGLPIELVDDVFHVDGDQLGLGVASSKIDRAKSSGTKQLALLVAVGRQAGGFDEDWTTSAEIRRICDEYGRFDPNNFAGTLTEMDEWFQFRGQRQQREVRLKRAGLEEGARLMKRLAGPGGEEGDE